MTTNKTLKDFLYHLHDTIILLGGGTEIAKMIDLPDAITHSDVEVLKRHNIKLITLTKDKLANTHKVKIRL